MIEHYPDSVRRERRNWMILQGIVLQQKGFEESDWGWLDELEDRRWGDGAESPDKPKPKTQREMLAELREQGLKQLREEKKEVVTAD